MSLSYAQLDSLTINPQFLARVRQAVASHAEYWLINPGSTDAQKTWCDDVFINGQCAQKAANMARELCQDAAITSSSSGDGADVTDAALQGAVDKICEKY